MLEFIIFILGIGSVCFWLGESPSISLIFVLIFSMGWGSVVSLFQAGSVLSMTIMLLVYSGGLFVITSFVVFSQPMDFNLGSFFTLEKSMAGGAIGLTFLVYVNSGSSGKMMMTISPLLLSSGYILLFFFILLVLILSLFVIDLLLEEGGEMFNQA